MGFLGFCLFVLAAEASALKFVEYDGYGDQEALHRVKRRLEFPLAGSDDNSTVVIEETTETCTWCDNDDLEVDDEHRATTVQRFNQYIAPGTCVENSSPRYPEKYPNNKDIRWTYTGASGSILTFKVIKGGVQKHYKCQRDYVEVFADGQRSRACGGLRNFERRSGSDSILNVKFVSNRRLQWNGYTAEVCAGEPPSTTSSTTTTSTSSTTSTSTTTETPTMCDDICGSVDGFTGRISNPTPAETTIPWVVIVDVFRDNLYIRGSGVLISRKHILTSAYIFYQGSPTGIDNVIVRVTAGEYDLSESETPAVQVLYTSDVTINENFNSTESELDYNLAILTLPDDGFTLNSRVLPICIGNSTVLEYVKANYASVYLSGFGWTASDYPATNMSTISVNFCNFVLGDYFFCLFTLNAPNTPCYGDTGSAYYQTYSDGRVYAVGMVNTISQTVCPVGGFVIPGTDLTYFYDWIDQQTSPRHCNP
ncbi:ovochymase-2-like [Penaeus chinensis]|uniref:ovochymase-2-like n=1 Tax=Penaeus chinensis TaxID=139456 RepID=UPI001FB5EC85|nr:ovochymase-2-like [Penaeus chinensis]